MGKAGMGGAKDRAARIGQRRSGVWRTVSSDLLYLASKLYKLSEQEANYSATGNSSKMVFAGIPLLMASIHALIIECESMGVIGPPAIDPWKPLPEVLSARYGLSGECLKDFECLCEIRNEIVHPVPLPTGSSDNWPDYLRWVKKKKLTVEHPDQGVHYTFFDQLASQKLFTWSVLVTQEAYRAVVNSVPNRGMLLPLFLAAFANFAPDRKGRRTRA